MNGAPKKAIPARYADWRPVKSRKVLQLILEVPLERQGEVLTMLGAPLPDKDIQVAIAIMSEQPDGTFKGGKLARSAGILSSEGAFQKWSDTDNPDDAATFIRERCGVSSRAHLDHDETAARAFRDMKMEYENWLRGMAA